MEIGKRIKEARDKLGWSGNELAERSGLLQSAVSKIERGLVENPSVFTIAAIAKTLGVTIDELLGSVEVTPRAENKLSLKTRITNMEDVVNEMRSILANPSKKKPGRK